MEDGASGEMVAGGQGAPAGRRGGGAKRGRRERESVGGGAMVAWGQQQQGQGGASASASRICRVKPNGGKDRHSKVVTAKGVRDRRVRLAVPTAIQFYDLQDRLGFDQPSKAVEWLINAASHAIDKLPPLDPTAFHAAAAVVEVQQAGSKGKQLLQAVQQGSSSTSETSKGSDLSLSRSNAARVAGGRSSSSRDKQMGVTVAATSAQAASFTELLTGNAIVAAASEHIQSWHRQQPCSAADCVGFAHPGKNKGAAQGAPPRFGNAPPLGMVPARPLPSVPAQPFDFTTSAGEITPFSFAQDVLAAASAPAPAPAPAPAGDYSLDFSMSSGFMGGGNSRGTLQSNSQSQYFSNQLQFHGLDGPSPPFLYDQTAALAAHPSSENHRFTGTPPLQLWNGFRMEEKSQN